MTWQVCYNMIFRAVEHEIAPFCAAHGIQLIAYSPLMQGLLTGRNEWKSADDVRTHRQPPAP
jgi:aryl-alcohol dehydrogenase-like predicted oxidoreductase